MAALVVAGCDGTEIFQPVDRALDDIAASPLRKACSRQFSISPSSADRFRLAYPLRSRARTEHSGSGPHKR